MGFSSGARASKTAALFFIALAAAAPLLSACSPKPVAVVNGKSLSEAEFAKLCEQLQYDPQRGGTVGLQALARWVEATLLADEAKQLNVYPSDKDLDERIRELREDAAFRGGNLDEDLRRQGVTQEALRREIKSQMVRDNVLYRSITVSDEEVKKQFDKSKEQFNAPEQVEISQITVDSEAALKEARNDLGQNAQFSIVARTRSKDRFAQQGGRVPVPLSSKIPAGGPVSQAVVDTAFKLKEGAISDPIKVGSTWVIVKLEKKIPARARKFEDVKEVIRASLRQQKAQQGPANPAIQQGLQKMAANAHIQVNRPEYQMLERQFGAAAAGAAGPGGAPGGAPGAGGPPPAPGGPPPAPGG